MSEADGSAAFALLILGVLAYLAFGPGNTTAEADQIDCAQFAKNANGTAGSCARHVLGGFWKIAVNNSAGKCSVLYRSRDNKTQEIISGTSLAFVDRDNWECRGPKLKQNIQLVTKMSDGELSIAYVDLDYGWVTKEPIKRADGWIGTPLHYWRLLSFYVEKNIDQ